MRLLSHCRRKKGRGLDAVLSLAGQVIVRHRGHHAWKEIQATKFLSIVVLSTVGLLAGVSMAAYRTQMGMGAADRDQNAEAVVDRNGNLRVPTHYRRSYQFLGSWAIAADKGQGSKALHVVYASRGTIAGYQRTGRFPDGSVLVKEVYQTATQPMATGTVSRAQNLQGWFVMVKESKDVHPNNKLWGDGWA
jgi:hypothetical protein